MNARTTAILGKGGVGKTFVAAHLAMALGYLGSKTLVVGGDQKQDLSRMLGGETRGSLLDWLHGRDPAGGEVAPEQVIVPVSDYVHVLELGSTPILTGDYGEALRTAFTYFAAHSLFEEYEQVIFDVTEERWDSTLAPLYKRVEGAIAVTDESPESLFVLNRLFRAIQIGAYEFSFPMVALGVVNNVSRGGEVFEAYVGRTQCFPLLTIRDSAELAALKPYGRTLFSLNPVPESLLDLHDGLVRLADLLRGTLMNVTPVATLNDEDIWSLAPESTLPS